MENFNNDQTKNMKIYCASLLFFMGFFICRCGYQVFHTLLFPDNLENDEDDRNTATTSSRSHAIHENPFQDFV